MIAVSPEAPVSASIPPDGQLHLVGPELHRGKSGFVRVDVFCPDTAHFRGSFRLLLEGTTTPGPHEMTLSIPQGAGMPCTITLTAWDAVKAEKDD
jgi:hypothetical protein